MITVNVTDIRRLIALGKTLFKSLDKSEVKLRVHNTRVSTTLSLSCGDYRVDSEVKSEGTLATEGAYAEIQPFSLGVCVSLLVLEPLLKGLKAELSFSQSFPEIPERGLVATISNNGIEETIRAYPVERLERNPDGLTVAVEKPISTIAAAYALCTAKGESSYNFIKKSVVDSYLVIASTSSIVKVALDTMIDNIGLLTLPPQLVSTLAKLRPIDAATVSFRVSSGGDILDVYTRDESQRGTFFFSCPYQTMNEFFERLCQSWFEPHPEDHGVSAHYGRLKLKEIGTKNWVWVEDLLMEDSDRGKYLIEGANLKTAVDILQGGDQIKVSTVRRSPSDLRALRLENDRGNEVLLPPVVVPNLASLVKLKERKGEKC